MPLNWSMQDVLSRLGHFGWIPPALRTQKQQDAAARALSQHVAFALPPVRLAKGEKVLLTDLWSDQDIVADIGQPFTGFHQLTGSCVGASSGNAQASLSFVQRKLTAGTTKAFVPWWPQAYGRTRLNEGDRGQGEGAVDSVMGQTLCREGTYGITEVQGLPQFKTDDGLYLTEQIEMQWSDGAGPASRQLSVAGAHLLGSAATLNTPDDVETAIVNGYPVLDGCALFAGHGSITGSGDTAYVRGKYDGRGGHSTCFLGAWHHPNDGRLFLYSNQWPTSTYPRDPAGGGRCCVWLPESELTRVLFSGVGGGGGGETMALSHLSYFPAQPVVLDWARV